MMISSSAEAEADVMCLGLMEMRGQDNLTVRLADLIYDEFPIAAVEKIC